MYIDRYYVHSYMPSRTAFIFQEFLSIVCPFFFWLYVIKIYNSSKHVTCSWDFLHRPLICMDLCIDLCILPKVSASAVNGLLTNISFHQIGGRCRMVPRRCRVRFKGLVRWIIDRGESHVKAPEPPFHGDIRGECWLNCWLVNPTAIYCNLDPHACWLLTIDIFEDIPMGNANNCDAVFLQRCFRVLTLELKLPVKLRKKTSLKANGSPGGSGL